MKKIVLSLIFISTSFTAFGMEEMVTVELTPNNSLQQPLIPRKPLPQIVHKRLSRAASHTPLPQTMEPQNEGHIPTAEGLAVSCGAIIVLAICLACHETCRGCVDNVCDYCCRRPS